MKTVFFFRRQIFIPGQRARFREKKVQTFMQISCKGKITLVGTQPESPRVLCSVVPIVYGNAAPVRPVRFNKYYD